LIEDPDHVGLVAAEASVLGGARRLERQIVLPRHPNVEPLLEETLPHVWPFAVRKDARGPATERCAPRETRLVDRAGPLALGRRCPVGAARVLQPAVGLHRPLPV